MASGSYDKIDYRLRPAKSVERKMLCDLMRELRAFGPLKDYTYIGFGSVAFVDFSLVHRSLGIESMHSIERDAEAQNNPILQNRFEFNRPFSCIDIHYGPASDHLGDEKMGWDRKAIVWLDYDDPLQDEYVNDLQIVLQNALPGSLILISVNVQAVTPPRRETKEDEDEDREEKLTDKEFRYRELSDRINADSLPPGIRDKNLGTVDLLETYLYVLNGAVASAISQRNGSEPSEITPHQLINMRYKDGSDMATFGWLLVDETQKPAYEEAGLDRLGFLSRDKKPFKIEVPPLTPKEIAWLDAALHRHINKDGTVKLPTSSKSKDMNSIRLAPAIRGTLVNQYVKIYRYFPTFAEAIF